MHGSIIDGVFRGQIVHPQNGTYYVDEIYEFHGGATKGQSPLQGYQGHSVIYHHDDVIMPQKLAFNESLVLIFHYSIKNCQIIFIMFA